MENDVVSAYVMTRGVVCSQYVASYNYISV